MSKSSAHILEQWVATGPTLLLPEDRDGMPSFMWVGVEGVTSTVAKNKGMGMGWKGLLHDEPHGSLRARDADAPQ